MRTPAYTAVNDYGNTINVLKYKSYKIYDGKYSVEGMPSLFAGDNKAMTLKITAVDEVYRNNLCRSKWAKRDRPILINNWEGTYFDFTEEKLLSIAKTAAEAGCELFVLDDGWFGKRNTDTCSLGDWYVNSEKLPNGIDGLAQKINDMGMMFGLWFEPEMVNPDSDLYRTHPDWAISVPERAPAQFRFQYILDLSRDDVCRYVIDAVAIEAKRSGGKCAL